MSHRRTRLEVHSNRYAALGIDTKKMFGTKSEVDPISHLIGTAVVWGGSPPSAAVYEGITPTLNDGKTAYKLTVKGRAS